MHLFIEEGGTFVGTATVDFSLLFANQRNNPVCLSICSKQMEVAVFRLFRFAFAVGCPRKWISGNPWKSEFSQS
jgi:hypothetical protein